MKQQILCLRCYHPVPKYPGEWSKTVQGEAIKPMKCDLCSADIEIGQLCYAQSLGTNRQPYYPWEHHYIKH